MSSGDELSMEKKEKSVPKASTTTTKLLGKRSNKNIQNNFFKVETVAKQSNLD